LDDLSLIAPIDGDSRFHICALGQMPKPLQNPLIDVHRAELVFWLSYAKRRSPPAVWLRGRNHTSTMVHIGTTDEFLGLSMLDSLIIPDHDPH
jgi:hypothetical protein